MTRRLISRICLVLVVCGLVLAPAVSAIPSQDRDSSSPDLRLPVNAKGYFTALWHGATDWVRLRPQTQATKDTTIVPVPYPPYFIIIVTSGGGTGVTVSPDG